MFSSQVSNKSLKGLASISLRLQQQWQYQVRKGLLQWNLVCKLVNRLRNGKLKSSNWLPGLALGVVTWTKLRKPNGTLITVKIIMAVTLSVPMGILGVDLSLSTIANYNLFTSKLGIQFVWSFHSSKEKLSSQRKTQIKVILSKFK